MCIINIISINPVALKLTLALTGYLFISLGLAMLMYYNSFINNGEMFEATVVKIKETQYYSKDAIQVLPVVEYTVNGRLVKAKHFIPVFKNTLDFTVGDTINIIVNPKYPSTFMIENFDIKTIRKNDKIIMLIGAAFIAAAIIAYIFF